MDEAPPAAAGAAAEKKRPLLRRVPTSLLVTLLGIALTAWLLPAFTHQWDDRQKSRELKADLVAQMSSAAVKAVVTVRRYYSPRTDADWAARDDAKDDWQLASRELEARLRSYFPVGIANVWAEYRLSVERYFWLPATSGGTAADVAKFREGVNLLILRDPEREAELVDEWRGGNYIGAFEGAGDTLLEMEVAIADQVLAAHARGYSTSTRDLLRDLIP